MTEQQYLQEQRDELERLNREHNVIKSISELSGWEILHLERYKPGVVIYRATKPMRDGMEFKSGFAKDHVFSAIQLPP